MYQLKSKENNTLAGSCVLFLMKRGEVQKHYNGGNNEHDEPRKQIKANNHDWIIWHAYIVLVSNNYQNFEAQQKNMHLLLMPK